MAFQYAHHRPMTPITPIHSPHPSGGSSIRARTPGQLSLHEYRKMQVTPSPPAVPGQKTVKKKRGLSSLSRTVGPPAESPNSDFFSSFASLTTPPETPSLGVPMYFNSDVLPVSMTHNAHVVHASVDSGCPELVHLGSESSSSPYSPPLPALSSSALRGSVLQRLVNSHRNFTRPWSQPSQQDHRYVELHTNFSRPRSEQPARRVTSGRAAMSEFRGLSDFQDMRLDGRTEASLSVPEIPNRPARGGTESHQRLGASTKGFAGSSLPDVWSSNTSRENLSYSRFHEDKSGSWQSRERTFNSIKRLPRPAGSTKRRPAPLRFPANPSEGSNFAGSSTTTTSRFSQSKPAFPQKPDTPLEDLESKPLLSLAHDDAATRSPHISAKSPSIRFSGVSFEIVNPRHSFKNAGLVESDEEGKTDSYPSGQFANEILEDMSDNNSDGPPRTRHHETYHQDFQAVTGSASRSSSVTREAAEHAQPLSRNFNGPSSIQSLPDANDRAINPGAHQEYTSPSGQSGRQTLPFVSETPLYRASIPGLSPSTGHNGLGGPYDQRLSTYAHDIAVALPNYSHEPRVPYAAHPNFSHGSDQVSQGVSVPAFPFRERQTSLATGTSLPYSNPRLGTRDLGPQRNGHGSVGVVTLNGRYVPGSVDPFALPEVSQAPQQYTPAANRMSDLSVLRNRHRESDYDPFAYDRFDTARPLDDTNTISGILDNYYAPNRGDNPFGDPEYREGVPEYDDESIYSNDHPLAMPSTLSSPYAVTNDRDPDRPTWGTLPPWAPPPGTVLSRPRNGHSVGVSGAGSIRIPLRQRYMLGELDSLRGIPINEAETLADFEELVDDILAQPLMEPRDSAYWERRHTLLNRLEEVFGHEHRRAAERDIERDDRRRANTYHSSSQSNIEDASIPPMHTENTGAAGPIGVDVDPLFPDRSHSEIATGQDALRRVSSSLNTGYESDDDDFIDQHEPQFTSSPLEANARPPFLVNERIDDAYLLNGPNTVLPSLPGPPPDYPLPGLPEDNAENGNLPQVPLPFIDPPILAESSEPPSYEDTAQLLDGSASFRPIANGALQRQRSETVGAPLQRTGEPSGRLRGIPPMWLPRNSPPPSASHDRHSPISVGASSLSQTSDDIARAINDEDEWETTGSASRHNSAIPDQQSVPPDRDDNDAHSSISLSAHPDPSTITHPTGSNLPGFYPTENLSSEPHDGYENGHTFEPPRVVQRPGYAIDDIELGFVRPIAQPPPALHRPSQPVEDITSASSHPRLQQPPAAYDVNQSTVDTELGLAPFRSPLLLRDWRGHTRQPSRLQRGSNATNTTAFPGRHDLSSPNGAKSTLSNGSRTSRVYVPSQTGLLPLRLGHQPQITAQQEKLTSGQKLLADGIKWSCVTWLAPIAFFPLLLGFGVLDSVVHNRASTTMKRFALAQAIVIFMAIVVAATIGITLSVYDEKRANGFG